MLDVKTNHQIILLYFKEGLSLRKMAKQLRISKNTIKADVVGYERLKALSAKNLLNSGSAQGQYLTKEPVYDSGNQRKRKLKRQ